MRSVVWATFLVVATIGGCAEQTETQDVVDESDQSPTVELATFRVTLAVGNTTATGPAGADQANATGPATGNATGNATNNGTAAPADDAAALAPTANATAGNVTVALGIEAPEGLNASLVAWSLEADNGTGIVALANGTGLPALLNVTFNPGNVTLHLQATADGFHPAHVALDLEVLEGVPDDPCAGIGVQEPVDFSGLFTAAVLGSGFYSGNPFEVGPCQTKIFVELSSGEAALDPMLRLKDTSGASVDEEDNEFLYHETLTYEPGGYLEPGTWQIDVRGYAAGPGTYEGTVSFE